jgi:hypothetical protein
LVQYGSCAFGIATDCLPTQCPYGGIVTKIGNQDIIDIINESVKQLTWNGWVGSKGKMFCDEEGSRRPIPVKWCLYTNPQLLARETPETLSAPISTTSLSVRSRTDIDSVDSDQVNDCGDSDFINHTTDASPLVTDCQEMAGQLTTDKGYWPLIAGGTQYRTAFVRTCAFGLQTYCEGDNCPTPGTIVKVGDMDVVGLINDSVRRFSWNGKVGAAGHMKCQEQTTDTPRPVQWGLYHLDFVPGDEPFNITAHSGQ